MCSFTLSFLVYSPALPLHASHRVSLEQRGKEVLIQPNLRAWKTCPVALPLSIIQHFSYRTTISQTTHLTRHSGNEKAYSAILALSDYLEPHLCVKLLLNRPVLSFLCCILDVQCMWNLSFSPTDSFEWLGICLCNSLERLKIVCELDQGMGRPVQCYLRGVWGLYNGPVSISEQRAVWIKGVTFWNWHGSLPVK